MVPRLALAQPPPMHRSNDGAGVAGDDGELAEDMSYDQAPSDDNDDFEST